MDNNISFSKIVATPTLNSWSQAYNAGKLFAVLSLEKNQEAVEIESLNMLGKDFLERLEQEFFVIEAKNLETIKKAVVSIFESVPKDITVSFAAGALVNNILYLFSLGNAKVFIKRDGLLGIALAQENPELDDIDSSSGFIKDKDLIVLATDAFSKVITQDELNSSLNDSEPLEITEALAPKVHQAENGKISAIVIKYQNPLPDPLAVPDDLNEALESKEISDETGLNQPEEALEEVKKPIFSLNKYLNLFKTKFKSADWRTNWRVQSSKKLFFVAAVIIAVILISSIFLGIQEQNRAKARNLFAQIYPQAQKKYEEGEGLTDLNKIFARDAFYSAQKILKDNLSSFLPKSRELIQAQDLLTKVEKGLSLVSPIDKSGLDRSSLSVTVQNGSGAEGAAGKAAIILKDFGYNVLSTGNADNYNYEGVTIKVREENSAFLELIKKDLSKDYTVSETSSDLPSSFPTNAVIIIGK